MATYAFPWAALVNSVPVYGIVVRNNLVQNGYASRKWALFWSVGVPWIAAAALMAGAQLAVLVNWGSLLTTIPLNFILPSFLFVASFRRRRPPLAPSSGDEEGQQQQQQEEEQEKAEKGIAQQLQYQKQRDEKRQLHVDVGVPPVEFGATGAVPCSPRMGVRVAVKVATGIAVGCVLLNVFALYYEINKDV